MANQAHIWTQEPNDFVLTHSTSSKDLKCIGLTNEFFSQLIKIWLYTEKSNFDFLVKIKCQGSFFIKTCQIMKLVHQETQKCKLGFKMENFHNLEIFQVIKFSYFFLTLSHFFHQDENGLKENLQHESCILSQSLQLWLTKFYQKRLVSQVMIFGTRVPKTFNLEKICPNLGRFWPIFLAIFHIVTLGVYSFI